MHEWDILATLEKSSNISTWNDEYSNFWLKSLLNHTHLIIHTEKYYIGEKSIN